MCEFYKYWTESDNALPCINNHLCPDIASLISGQYPPLTNPMKPIYVKLKKILLWSAIAVAVCIVLVLSLISPIAKYLVEKYDAKDTGRNIEVGWILLNPFTGYIKINELKIYEQSNPQHQAGIDSLFFSSKCEGAFPPIEDVNGWYRNKASGTGSAWRNHYSAWFSV